ncbi:LysR family transcriptional regulator [Alteromonadaceae bacterium M269]|nr:LysR family transcriptional regulator [Alteromonadaceae bacterium M269]
MQVSLQALKTFEAAARLGSFKQAAEELAITPTAVSHHINNLESRLNVDLFHRRPRKVSLTEVGVKLAAATYDGFRKIESALEDIQSSNQALRVSTTSSLAALVLIPSLGKLQAKYPEIKVEVLTGEAIDNQVFNLPIRLGNIAKVQSSDVVKTESFSLFGVKECLEQLDSANRVRVYTTEWKNRDLPKPPLEAWLELNGWDTSKIDIQSFDQELFGIQEALASNGLVFCSTTLTQQLVASKLLQAVSSQPVVSDLCYYVPNKDSYTDRKTGDFLSWFATLLA